MMMHEVVCVEQDRPISMNSNTRHLTFKRAYMDWVSETISAWTCEYSVGKMV